MVTSKGKLEPTIHVVVPIRMEHGLPRENHGSRPHFLLSEKRWSRKRDIPLSWVGKVWDNVHFRLKKIISLERDQDRIKTQRHQMDPEMCSNKLQM